MNEAEARAIMSAVTSLNAGLGGVDDIISDMSDGTWKERLTEGLGGVFAALLHGLVEPLTKEFPQSRLGIEDTLMVGRFLGGWEVHSR